MNVSWEDRDSAPAVGDDIRLLPLGDKGSPVDSALYEAVNARRDKGEATRITAENYGGVDVVVDQIFSFEYSQIGVVGEFYHEDPKTGGQAKEKTNVADISYNSYRPVDPEKRANAPTIVLTHGVPVSKEEWHDVARLLGRVMNVITVDLLGMGESSSPVAFKNDAGEWHWSWQLHARVFRLMFEKLRRLAILPPKFFFGANDWGAGVVQKYVDLYGDDYLHGAIIGSPIALNGYWVQHIGSLGALTFPPYPSPQFTGAAIQFQGSFTGLIETMFHRTPYIHNQYTMQWLQNPYVNTRSYDDPTKNPSTTVYREHKVRVLAEQAWVVLGNGQLLPWHEEKNPQGLRFSKWSLPVLVLWGRQDKMMPEGQAHVFAEIARAVRANGGSDKFVVTPAWLDEAGHFAVSDQPEKAADYMLHWMQNAAPAITFPRAFLGFDTISRRDFDSKTKALEKLFQN